MQNDSGEWITEPNVIRHMVINFFASLYTESNSGEITNGLLLDRFPQLSKEDYLKLAKPFTAQEIRDAFFSMGPFKASGPGGFQALFIKNTATWLGAMFVKWI